MLGRPYVWPLEIDDEDDDEIDNYGNDLRIVLDRAREIRQISLQEKRAFPVMDKEIAILEQRLARLQKRIPQESEWPWEMDS